MKKLIVIPFLLGVTLLYSQANFVTFEFMKVEDQHLLDFMALEDFWSKIHQEGIKEGAYSGWDLWSLKPGGQDQGYQFLVVTVYDDVKKMLKGSSIEAIMARAAKAYPGMSQEEIMKRAMSGAASRSRAMIMHIAVTETTEGTFDMPLGTIATLGMMKANNNSEYEKAESEVFKPVHQKSVDQGLKGSWSLGKILSPTGSDAYASHTTINMYKDLDQYLSEVNTDLSTFITDWEPVTKGLETRDMKYVYMATLERKLR